MLDALLADIEAGGAKDALPLLAFTLERLYVEYGGRRRSDARRLRSAGPHQGLDRGGGRARVEGGRCRSGDSEGPRRAAGAAAPRPHSVACRHRSRHRRAAPPRCAAVGNSRRSAAADPAPGRAASAGDRRDQGYRRGHHRAGARGAAAAMGSAAGLARRRCRAACRAGGRQTREPRLGGERPRAAPGSRTQTDRLAAAERLAARPDLAANLEPTDRDYLAACRKAEADAKRGKRLVQAVIYVLLVGIIVGLVGWINQSYHQGAVALVHCHAAVHGRECSALRAAARPGAGAQARRYL